VCPGFVNVDLRLAKTFAFGQAHELEVIGQLFDVANHATYNIPTSNITAAFFGQATSLLPNINAPSRQVEIAVRYRF
jgi:hypothetical protein